MMKSPIYDYSHNQSLYLRLVIHFFLILQKLS